MTTEPNPTDRRAETRLLDSLPLTGARVRRLTDGRFEVFLVGEPGTSSTALAGQARTVLIAEFDIDPLPGDIHVVAETPLREVKSEPERRLLFRSANVYREGARADVQVELTDGAERLVGMASGPSLRQSLGRLVARATLEAVGRRLADGQAVDLVALERTRLGDRRVMICHLVVTQGRDERHLTGSALVARDPLEATVFSVLDALNRILPGLRTVEAGDDWIEYEVDAVR